MTWMDVAEGSYVWRTSCFEGVSGPRKGQWRQHKGLLKSESIRLNVRAELKFLLSN